MRTIFAITLVLFTAIMAPTMLAGAEETQLAQQAPAAPTNLVVTPPVVVTQDNTSAKDAVKVSTPEIPVDVSPFVGKFKFEGSGSTIEYELTWQDSKIKLMRYTYAGPTVSCENKQVTIEKAADPGTYVISGPGCRSGNAFRIENLRPFRNGRLLTGDFVATGEVQGRWTQQYWRQ